MATLLKMEALIHVGQNEDLQKTIAGFMGLQPEGVKTALLRNSKSLTTYRAVLAIAESMEKQPDEILDDTPN